MRSVLLVSIMAFLVIIAGGYGISWYSQAQATKNAFEQAIEQINGTQKLITYEAIETSGFPLDVYVSIVKPHFKGRFDQLLSTPAEAKSASQPWDEDAFLDGKITFGINALSDHYTMAVSGNVHEISTINGQTISNLHQQTGDFTCNLQLERNIGIFETLWNFQSLDRDSQTLAKDFRLLDCNSAGQQSTDSTSKAALSSSGPVRLFVTNAPQKENQRVRFYFTMANMEITPQGDVQLADYFQAISSNMPTNFSIYGKQNIAIDFSYSIPSDWQASNKNSAVDVALNKMDITNQVYTSHATFHYNNEPLGSDTARTLSLHSEINFSEQYDALVRAIANNFVKQLYASNDPQLLETKKSIQKYTPDELFSIINPAIPVFHSLGQVEVALDGSFKGNADTAAGDYKLDKLQLSATPYGITGNGNVTIAENDLPPTGNIQINCTNCLIMFDDIIDYSARLQKMMSHFSQTKPDIMTIDLVQLEAVKKLLSLLSIPAKTPSDTTLTYSITSSAAGISVNDRSIEEIRSLYNEYVHPTVKKANPANPQH